MAAFDANELLLDNYRNQTKCLKELYELMNDELCILNTMVEIGISEDDYQKIRNQAILLLKEREDKDEQKFN